MTGLEITKMTVVYYSRLRKSLGLEVEERVPVPNKVARRITMLAKQLKDARKDEKN